MGDKEPSLMDAVTLMEWGIEVEESLEEVKMAHDHLLNVLSKAGRSFENFLDLHYSMCREVHTLRKELDALAVEMVGLQGTKARNETC